MISRRIGARSFGEVPWGKNVRATQDIANQKSRCGLCLIEMVRSYARGCSSSLGLALRAGLLSNCQSVRYGDSSLQVGEGMDKHRTVSGLFASRTSSDFVCPSKC